MGFKVNVGRAVADRFLHDFVDKANDGGVLILVFLFFRLIGGDIGFIEAAGAYAEALGDGMDNLLGVAEVPLRLTTTGSKNPAIHFVIWWP